MECGTHVRNSGIGICYGASIEIPCLGFPFEAAHLHPGQVRGAGIVNRYETANHQPT